MTSMITGKSASVKPALALSSSLAAANNEPDLAASKTTSSPAIIPVKDLPVVPCF